MSAARLAESIGAVAVDDSAADPVEAVLEQTTGLGADDGCECVGHQAHDLPVTNSPTTR